MSYALQWAIKEEAQIPREDLRQMFTGLQMLLNLESFSVMHMGRRNNLSDTGRHSSRSFARPATKPNRAYALIWSLTWARPSVDNALVPNIDYNLGDGRAPQ